WRLGSPLAQRLVPRFRSRLMRRSSPDCRPAVGSVRPPRAAPWVRFRYGPPWHARRCAAPFPLAVREQLRRADAAEGPRRGTMRRKGPSKGPVRTVSEPMGRGYAPVSLIMSHDVPCVSQDLSVETFAELLLSRGLTGVPVVDDAGGLAGYLSLQDLEQDH